MQAQTISMDTCSPSAEAVRLDACRIEILRLCQEWAARPYSTRFPQHAATLKITSKHVIHECIVHVSDSKKRELSPLFVDSLVQFVEAYEWLHELEAIIAEQNETRRNDFLLRFEARNASPARGKNRTKEGASDNKIFKAAQMKELLAKLDPMWSAAPEFKQEKWVKSTDMHDGIRPEEAVDQQIPLQHLASLVESAAEMEESPVESPVESPEERTRNKEILHLFEETKLLRQLQTEIASMLMEQQDGLDTVEQHLDSVQVRALEGNEQLSEAAASMKSSHVLRMTLTGVLIGAACGCPLGVYVVAPKVILSMAGLITTSTTIGGAILGGITARGFALFRWG